MKSIINKYTLIGLIAAGSMTGCEDFLQEENRSSISIELAKENAETFNQMVARVYQLSRDWATHMEDGQPNIFTLEDLGTDIVTRGTGVIGTDAINDYVNMNSTIWDLELYWRNQYRVIAAANVVMDNADIIIGVDESVKATGIAEAKFFRAWAYYQLVENFGGVPITVNQVTVPEYGYARASEEEVYTLIVSDLNDALAGVPEDVSEFGRVSKDAVRHLTSKVLLTRGYKSFGSSSDFTEAASLAETVIANHPLESSFASVVDISNERNDEVIFSYLFGTNVTSRGWGNSRHMLYKFEYYNYPGMARGNLYQRGIGPAPTEYFFDLFEAGDQRDDATFRRVIYADLATADLAVGDTAMYFPETAWDEATIATKKYAVINPGTYFINDGVTNVHYPMFKKFDNPGVAFKQPNEGTEGTRDMVMMRGGEAYLIAAEAYLKSGNTATAAARLSTLRARAGLTTAVSASEVDLDFILDERARELVGEVNRWIDLKRTGKLVERVLAHNPHAALNNVMTSTHTLRPIPQREIDVTNKAITQNEGYN